MLSVRRVADDRLGNVDPQRADAAGVRVDFAVDQCPKTERRGAVDVKDRFVPKRCRCEPSARLSTSDFDQPLVVAAVGQDREPENPGLG
jgi:hypothetical protein